jgi:hypothetical protein
MRTKEEEFIRVVEKYERITLNGLVQIVYGVFIPTSEQLDDIKKYISNYNARSDTKEIISTNDILSLQNKPNDMFVKDLSYKTYYVYKTLKKHATGYRNKKSVKYILDQLWNDYNIKMVSRELRTCLNELKNSHTITRIIGSNTNGLWLACKTDEVDANAMRLSSTMNSIETLINNGVNINIFFDKLNELKGTHHATHNQQRTQFNTEKKEIHRYSDDLIEKLQ